MKIMTRAKANPSPMMIPYPNPWVRGAVNVTVSTPASSGAAITATMLDSRITSGELATSTEKQLLYFVVQFVRLPDVCSFQTFKVVMARFQSRD